jgi:hypothetical protein
VPQCNSSNSSLPHYHATITTSILPKKKKTIEENKKLASANSKQNAKISLIRNTTQSNS